MKILLKKLIYYLKVIKKLFNDLENNFNKFKDNINKKIKFMNEIINFYKKKKLKVTSIIK